MYVFWTEHSTEIVTLELINSVSDERDKWIHQQQQ